MRERRMTTARRVRRNGPSTATAAWTPANWSSSQLYCWYTSAGINEAAGNPVTLWSDSSGNGRHLDAVGGTPDVVQPNIRKGVKFTRADSDYMWLGANENIPTDASGTFFCVIRGTTGASEGSANGIGGFGASSTGSRQLICYLDPNTGWQPRINWADGTTNLARTNGGTGQIVLNTVYDLVFEADGPGAAYRIWQNGVAQGSLVTSGTQGAWMDDLVTQFNRFGIGCVISNATPNSHLDGTIYEFGLYRGVVTGGDITNLLTYLAAVRAEC